jgi:hypothetical protein
MSNLLTLYTMLPYTAWWKRVSNPGHGGSEYKAGKKNKDRKAGQILTSWTKLLSHTLQSLDFLSFFLTGLV